MAGKVEKRFFGILRVELVVLTVSIALTLYWITDGATWVKKDSKLKKT